MAGRSIPRIAYNGINRKDWIEAQEIYRGNIGLRGKSKREIGSVRLGYKKIIKPVGFVSVIIEDI